MGLGNFLIMLVIIAVFALVELILIEIVIKGLNRGIERIDKDRRRMEDENERN